VANGEKGKQKIRREERQDSIKVRHKHKNIGSIVIKDKYKWFSLGSGYSNY
jgi:hypothetical protein